MQLYNDKCENVLKLLEADSIDAMVTDPPAGISFMGKDWDKDHGGRDNWIAYMTGIFAECLRVLKPGAHDLVWALPRTSHWTATALENAGFEIRDVVNHIFGSGFPKSLNIGKAVDKMGNKIKELQNFTKWFDDVCLEKGLTNKQIDEYLGLDSGGSTCSHYRGWNTQQPRYPREAHFKRLKQWMGFGDLWDEKIAEVERELVGVQEKAMSGWNMDGTTQFKDRDITKGTSEWEGWGTALKPACEHWILVRKPLGEKTVAANVLAYGVGGLNIDKCRIETNDNINSVEGGIKRRNKINQEQGFRPYNAGFDNQDKEVWNQNQLGRFPANVILDDSEVVRAGFPETGKTHGGRNASNSKNAMFPLGGKYDDIGDSGSAARFFYCAKASKRDRDEGLEGF